MPPGGGDRRERPEHERPLGHRRVGHAEARGTDPPRAEEEEVEVEDARAPAPPRSPAEVLLDRLERPKEGYGRTRPKPDRNGVREPACRGAERGRLDKGGQALDAEPGLLERGDGGLENAARRPIPPPAVGAERNGDPCWRPAALPASTCAMRDPSPDCPLCPRLVAFRAANRALRPDWFNAPVPGFGDPLARLLIVGLAPGLLGANRTGRPFTGDHAGLLLYDTLLALGLATGHYAEHAGDGLVLEDTFISNAVRCVPPSNRPTPEEVRACRPFLEATIAHLPNLRVVLALGAVAHQSVVKALGGKLPKLPFRHGAVHRLPSGLSVVDSYHCSRLNQNTGTLTPGMFLEVVRTASDLRGGHA